MFTIDFADLPRIPFQRFFDCLAPAFAHMISLGQSNTIVSCPALTPHSELDEAELAGAGISPATIRIAVGDEDPKDLLRHFVETARLTIDPLVPGFSHGFPSGPQIDTIVEQTYIDAHTRYIKSKAPFGN